MSGWLQDLRLAVRHLRRRPLWTLSIVAVLAAGLAGNAAMFSAFDAWVMRPLAFDQPQELVAVGSTQPKLGADQPQLSGADWRDLVDRQAVLQGIGLYARARVNVDDELGASRIESAAVDADLFPTLRVTPAFGRSFTAAEDRPGRPAPVVLIGDRLWRERFGASSEALGRTLRVDGQALEVIGVMPPGFEFPEWAQVWTPLALDPGAEPRYRRRLSAVGRLASGVSLEAARDRLEGLGAELAAEHPATNDGWTLTATPLRDVWVPDVIEVALTASLGAAVLVLMVICANVGGLFLAELDARRRELALRGALGASRLRVLRPFALESVLLAALGGAAGCALGALWVRGMLGRVPLDPPYLFAMRLDLRTVLFTLAAAMVAGVACGLAPQLRRRRESPALALRSGGRAAAGSARLRGALVTAELALTTMLLIGALLMVKSFVAQRSVDPGYRIAGVVTAELSLAGPEHDEVGERVRFLERLLAGTSEPLRIESAGVASLRPADGCALERFEAEGAPAARGEGIAVCVVSVAGRYLETLDVPQVSGRLLHAEEWRDGGDAAVLSRGLAQRLWPDGDAVGRRLRAVGGGGAEWLRVVGVVGDVEAPRDMVRGPDAGVQLYRPYAAHPVRTVAVVVRTGARAVEVAELLQAAVRRAGAAVPLSEVLTLERSVGNAQWVSRFFSEQLMLYAAAALVIAVFGLYGLIADSVARTRFELAMRLALGARREQVMALVARRGAWTVGIGLIAGMALGGVASRLGASTLSGGSPFDPGVYALVAAVLVLTAALATWLPARRAARLDPARLLRSE
ncbi:MAG TPA: ADOP family duplicated permease [Thermoanaerobaculia bacterium]|nr:ADOP family duplicated permease [Thermoanaerobaculia bacterium]